MRRVPYLFAAAAIGSLALAATPSVAGPLASGLATGDTTLPAVEGLVQQVHAWHCRKRYSKRLGWHRHRRACHDYDYYDDYHDYSYGYGYPYGAPFLSFGFGFGDFDGGHRHHRRHGHKWRKKH